MLGDKILQAEGSITGRRVLPPQAQAVRMETTIQESGTMLGVEYMETATYWSEMRPDGTLYGEGEGIFMGRNGEAASIKGTGVGVFTPQGGVSFRGVLYYQTTTPAWAKLNSIAVVFEHEATAEGKTTSQAWEWK